MLRPAIPEVKNETAPTCAHVGTGASPVRRAQPGTLTDHCPLPTDFGGYAAHRLKL